MNQPEEFGDRKQAAVLQLKAARATLREAELLLENEAYSGTLNRSYYAIFHAICALHSLDGKSYKRHKDTIGNFNKDYVRTGIFPKDYGGKVIAAEAARHSSDSSEYFEPTREEAETQVAFAREFIAAVENYCKERIGKADGKELPQ